MTSRTRSVLAIACLGQLACAGRSEPKFDYPYSHPALSEVELERELRGACGTSVHEDKPLLIEFGARVCAPCSSLNEMSRTPVFSSELSRFVLKPQDCRSLATQWPRAQPRVWLSEPDAHQRNAQELARARRRVIEIVVNARELENPAAELPVSPSW